MMRRAEIVALALLAFVACTAKPGATPSYCDVVTDINALAGATASVDVDQSMSDAEIDRRVERFQEQLDRDIERGTDLFADLERAAPPELAVDVRLVADDTIARAVRIRDANDPLAAMLPTHPDVGAARHRVDAHTREACGTALLPLDSGPPPDQPRPPIEAPDRTPPPVPPVPTAPTAPPAPPAPPEPSAPSEPPAPPEPEP